jgi:hypothetical protein
MNTNAVFRGETMTSEKYLTPPELGKLWGVGGDKVLALIHSGELRAVNLAVNGAGRPRFRIAESEIRRFEEVRTSKPPVPKVRRRRRQTMTTGKEYF